MGPVPAQSMPCVPSSHAQTPKTQRPRRLQQLDISPGLLHPKHPSHSWKNLCWLVVARTEPPLRRSQYSRCGSAWRRSFHLAASRRNRSRVFWKQRFLTSCLPVPFGRRGSASGEPSQASSSTNVEQQAIRSLEMRPGAAASVRLHFNGCIFLAGLLVTTVDNL